MALIRRVPADDLLHHSDQDSEYTSLAYQTILEHHSIRANMSRVGECDDNAGAESFFSSLKSFDTAFGPVNRLARLFSRTSSASPIVFDVTQL